MMPILKLKPRSLLQALALLLATALPFAAAIAGGSATVLAGEDFSQPNLRVVRSSIEFDGSQRVRAQTEARREGYLVVRDGAAYVVAQLQGQQMVFDYKQTMATMGGLARSLAPPSLITDGRYVSLTGPGAMETVAGIQGRVWLLTTVNQAGRERTDELVLTSDPKVRELTDALLATGRILARELPELDADANEQLELELSRRGTGILRVGSSFRLEKLDATSPSPSRFELPAAPTTLPDLGGFGKLFGN